MPTGQTVQVASDIYRAIRTDFVGTYKKTYDGLEKMLGAVMSFGKPSDKLTEYYGYFESAPYAARWDYGEDIPEKSFKSVAFNTTNYRYARRITWLEDMREDEQLRDLPSQAATCGEHFAILPEIARYEILSGTASVLPAIPNAPDGVAIASATDGGGGARFGISGGNIISGGGVTSAQLIITDIFAAVVRILNFQDTESQPLWNTNILSKGLTIEYGVANEEVFGRALRQLRQVETAGTAGTDLAAAAVTNFVKDYGLSINAVPTQRISDNDWWVSINNPPVPTTFEQVRRPLRERTAYGADNNSDHVRTTGEEYVQWDSRLGFGVGPAYSIVKVNN